MSHSYLFFLFSALIYLTIKWHKTPKRKYLFALAFLFGLSVLIRPTSILFGLFPLLYSNDFKSKFHLLKSNWKSILLAFPIFVIPIFVQLAYWKLYGGNWIIWSYGEEHFYFTNPHILDFLLSFRKGWLIYTPVMFLAIFGLFKLKNSVKPMRLSVSIILLLTVYVFSSWWCWWFGGSLGSRVMVEYYALLIFPLASAIHYFRKIKFVNIGLVLVLLFCISFNYIATHKYKWSQLHWDSMTKKAFFQTFSHPKMNQIHKEKYESCLKTPDYKNAKKGLEEKK